jgi:hypothetical protein
MKIVLASIFRDSATYLDRYFTQCRAFRAAMRSTIPPEHQVNLLWCEGDSTDQTYELLKDYAYQYHGIELFQYHHGGPKFASVDVEQRWRQLARVCNAVMERVPTDTDALVYVESDLIWQPETMVALVKQLERVDAVAPMCWHGTADSGANYESWGHRGPDGVKFTREAPYHPSLTQPADRDGLWAISSAGSCVVMRGEVARVARFGESDCIVGLGRSITERGYGLWLAPSLAVVHP